MKKRQTIRNSPVPDPHDARVGGVAVSLAGHDQGTILVIVAGLDEKYVLVADGRRRVLAAPKKKQMRHLRILTKLSEQDTESLSKGEANDCFLRRKLSGFDLACFT
jgi:ribosomal protein L14E/L6E/L27E